jgi:hypothetical protein
MTWLPPWSPVSDARGWRVADIDRFLDRNVSWSVVR